MGWNLENTYMKLPERFYRRQRPIASPAPNVVAFNGELGSDLGLNPDELRGGEVLAGNMLPEGANPIAQAYAGYQFGHFSMLGDGRAVLLGEQITPKNAKFDIQLKGAGPTPFSRGGDGFAALSPMLREFIISEAMHALEIPTTRSLAVIKTGRDVIREKVLQGAVLTRVASSHIRVGTFNYAAAYGSAEDVAALADYGILRHFPHLAVDNDKYLMFLQTVIQKQATLIAKWQLAGFVHGVMNTDNMAISGETIDYGPCAFLDVYNADGVFSSIDRTGRYAYKNQPHMAVWNLCRFAESLLPLLDENRERAIEAAKSEIEGFWGCFEEYWLDGMRAKLGLEDKEAVDSDIFKELLDLMQTHRLDYANTLYLLAHGEKIDKLADWQEKWRERGVRQGCTPAVIPRNHKVEEALAAAESGDFEVMERLLEALRKPYEYSTEYAEPPRSCGKYVTFCGT